MAKNTDNTNMPAENEYPSALIYKLCEFYNKYPDYKTGIMDISILARIVHTELEKFTRRPHKQVTEVFFDREPPTGHFI